MCNERCVTSRAMSEEMSIKRGMQGARGREECRGREGEGNVGAHGARGGGGGGGGRVSIGESQAFKMLTRAIQILLLHYTVDQSRTCTCCTHDDPPPPVHLPATHMFSHRSRGPRHSLAVSGCITPPEPRSHRRTSPHCHVYTPQPCQLTELDAAPLAAASTDPLRHFFSPHPRPPSSLQPAKGFSNSLRNSTAPLCSPSPLAPTPPVPAPDRGGGGGG